MNSRARNCVVHPASRLIFAVGLVLAAGSVPAVAWAAADCPIDRLVGQVTRVEMPVTLTRNGRQIPVKVRTCVLYGDRLDAGDNGQVDVETGEGHRRFGRFAAQSVWVVPDPNVIAPRSLLATLNDAFRAAFDPAHPPVAYGVSRDRRQCLETAPSGPGAVRPVSAAPVTAQRLGADIDVLPIGWKTDGPRRVSAQLVRPDGQVVARSQACLGDGTEVWVPKGALRLGEHLSLVISSSAGPAFAYPILVVRPDSLPRPDGPVSEAWLVAAWRVAAAGEDVRLDSLARLRLGERRSYAARRLLDALLSDEAPS